MHTPKKFNKGSALVLFGFIATLALTVIGGLIARQDILKANQVAQEAKTTLGAALPSGVAVFETALQSPITSSATTMTLAANAVSGGSVLSGFNCFTIDEGSSQAEYVCGTVSGTTVSAMTRGIDPITATTTNATLQFAHRRGADVKITDYPLIQIMRNQLNGSDTIPNVVLYTTGTGCVTGSASNSLCDKSYIDTRASAGAANATESVNGISQLATGAQAASSTSLGTTGARLVLPASLSTSTPGSAGLWNVMTANDGNISPLFLDGTAENYSFNGATTSVQSLNASSTLASPLYLNGLAYSLPSTRAASGTVLTENGSGVLTFQTVTGRTYSSYLIVATTTGSNIGSGVRFATTTMMTLPVNTLNASSTIEVDGEVVASAAAGGTILLKNGNIILAQIGLAGVGTNASTDHLNFKLLVLPSGSVSSQVGLGYGEEVNTQTLTTCGGTPCSYVINQSTNQTSVVNLASALTLNLVIQGNTLTLNQASMVVTP